MKQTYFRTDVKMAAGFEAKYYSADHGHHIHRDIRTSTISEVLMCKHKEENEHDRFAVA